MAKRKSKAMKRFEGEMGRLAAYRKSDPEYAKIYAKQVEDGIYNAASDNSVSPKDHAAMYQQFGAEKHQQAKAEKEKKKAKPAKKPAKKPSRAAAMMAGGDIDHEATKKLAEFKKRNKLEHIETKPVKKKPSKKPAKATNQQLEEFKKRNKISHWQTDSSKPDAGAPDAPAKPGVRPTKAQNEARHRELMGQPKKKAPVFKGEEAAIKKHGEAGAKKHFADKEKAAKKKAADKKKAPKKKKKAAPKRGQVKVGAKGGKYYMTPGGKKVYVK